MRALYVSYLLSYWLQLLLIPATAAGVVASGAGGAGGGQENQQQRQVQHVICLNNETNVETLRQARIAAIRQEVLLKLNLEVPPSDPTDIELDESVLATYHAALQTTNKHNAIERSGVVPQECGRRGNTFFAKQRRVYFPTIFAADVPLVEMFEWGSLVKRDKRGAINDRHDKLKREANDDKMSDSEMMFSDSEEKDSQSKVTKAPSTPPPTTQPPDDPKYPTLNGKSLDEYLSPILHRLVFSDIDTVPASLIWSVGLNLYKRKKHYDSPQIKLDTNPLESVQIYRVLQMNGTDGIMMSHSVLIGTKLVSTESDGYEQFDLTEAVREWMSTENRSSDLELEVLIRTVESVETGNLFLPSIEFDVPGFTEKGEENAQLVISIVHEEEQQNNAHHTQQNNTSAQRRKRSSHNGVKKQYCFSNPNEQNCCVRELVINFHEDLGFNWVLAPRSFQTNYCQGLCPYFWPSATESTSFLMQLRQTNPTSAPEPCCVANSVKSLTLLMVMNGRILLNELPDITVESCICR